ncbi:tRNA pseudouridine synthase A [Bifidobacterium xylocopae]|uniref:tRNA pseudouridine synthase A n=1 Tax=Bifidobacterium xylocopae TaxID=2493119 RepID=A0A366KDX1_9BIFI|nr:tRNA pseudouridine synthase A [Bifidobacterium xylocopae]RBP99432.1 tRNA pseudouridine(38-40) synthase TruA [Bifidobacterium xylocopae]
MQEGQAGRDTVRLRIDLAYDGGDFHGWARQPGLRTVQGEMEAALARVLGTSGSAGGRRAGGRGAGEPEGWVPRLVVAGRTDTGVHAAHQVCHLDIPSGVLSGCVGHMDAAPESALEHRLQRLLPTDIAIHRVQRAPGGFDARFSALERTYLYRVSEGRDRFDPRLRGFVLGLEGSLDLDAMNRAAATAVGLHDFGSFATPNPGGTTIRQVKYAHWDRVPGRPLLTYGMGAGPAFRTPAAESGLVVFTIVADAFAHNMVRSLVNACLRVGQGKRDADWFRDKVMHPLREGSTGPVAAQGLTLEHVAYPSDDRLAERASAIRAKRTLDG